MPTEYTPCLGQKAANYFPLEFPDPGLPTGRRERDGRPPLEDLKKSQGGGDSPAPSLRTWYQPEGQASVVRCRKGAKGSWEAKQTISRLGKQAGPSHGIFDMSFDNDRAAARPLVTALAMQKRLTLQANTTIASTHPVFPHSSDNLWSSWWKYCY